MPPLMESECLRVEKRMRLLSQAGFCRVTLFHMIRQIGKDYNAVLFRAAYGEALPPDDDDA